MGNSTVEEQAALVALLRERPNGMTWIQLVDVMLECGSASAARAQLVPDTLFGDDEHEARLTRARLDIAGWAGDGLEFIPILDDRYPARVREIHEAPPFLFARGQLRHDDVAVSVVGSRQASPEGLRMSTSISELLVSQGITVVAGLAAGIDTAAHLAALANRGRTVAVIGTGITRAYPAENRALQERIACEGLLLSQFWPDAPPQKHNFPMRNAVMSGYGIATIVVEASEHSGARIQARMAVHHGRPVILTDLVVTSTQWAKDLVGKPDVHVASSINDVQMLVDELRSRSEQLTAVLAELSL